jgi:hypothetical protein
MTNIDKFKSECKDILINNLGKCLQHLSDALSPESKLRDDVLLLKGDFIRWQRQSSQLSSIEYHQYLNRISNGLMNLINGIEAYDVAEFQFQDKILVVCRPEMTDKMAAFFGNRYFPNLSITTYVDKHAALPIGQFDIVLLEDMPTNSVSRTVLDRYVTEIKSHFMYYGNGRFDPPKEVMDKVYFANTPFALYGRIKELLDYIKYYGK